MSTRGKIDIHVHASLERLETGRKNSRNPMDSYIADPEEVRIHLEKQGITHAVLMSSGEHSENPELGTDNADCEAIAENPFYSWMCNFAEYSTEPIYDRMVACKAAGAVGVGELTVNKWLDNAFFHELFSAAESLALPVLFHMSPAPGFSYGVCDHPGLPLLEETLQTYPSLKVIGHSQMFWLEISADAPTGSREERVRMGRGPVREGGRLPYLFQTYPNLYGDLSAYSGSCAILRDEAFGLRFLEQYADRLFFGTDTLNQHQTFPLGKFLDIAVEEGSLSQKAYDSICFRNAELVFEL